MCEAAQQQQVSSALAVMHWKFFLTIVVYNTVLLGTMGEEGSGSGSNPANDTTCEDCNTDSNVPFFPSLPFICNRGPCQHRPIFSDDPSIKRNLDTSVLSLLPCTHLSKLTSLRQCDILSTISGDIAKLEINRDLPLFKELCFFFADLANDAVCMSYIIVCM